jgi:DNA-binding NarL/FixJ family response regulator
VLLAWIDLDRGDERRSREHVGELIELSALLRHPYLIAYSLEVAAALAERRGDAQRCVRLAGAAAAVRDRARVAAAAALRQRFEDAVARAAATLSSAEWDVATREGAAMSDEQLLAEARRVADVTPSRPIGPVSLTAREIEVLRLVAAGLTDAVIASRLHLSVRTVNAHLRAVYTKLGVSSRAAATRIATTEGVL